MLYTTIIESVLHKWDSKVKRYSALQDDLFTDNPKDMTLRNKSPKLSELIQCSRDDGTRTVFRYQFNTAQLQ